MYMTYLSRVELLVFACDVKLTLTSSSLLLCRARRRRCNSAKRSAFALMSLLADVTRAVTDDVTVLRVLRAGALRR